MRNLRTLCAVGTLVSASFAQNPFTEESVARGLVYTSFGAGRGVAFTDIDRDGDPDLICTGAVSGLIGVFENDGTGQFTDRSVGSGIPSLPTSDSIVCGDLDGDGYEDLFIGIRPGANVLLRNNGGDFTFTDVTATSGAGDPAAATGSTLADYDNDGWLDIYSSSSHDPISAIPNRLYRNNGNLTFLDVAGQLGVGFPGSITWQSVFFDYDLDGLPDLYLSNDKCLTVGQLTNQLVRNLGGTFANVTNQANVANCLDSMGVAIGDLDGNGYPDIYATDTGDSGGNPLLLNQGNGTFVEASSLAGITSFMAGWGTLFLDYDNDTYLDVYVCNAFQPNQLYVGGPTSAWPLVDMAGALNATDGMLNNYCLASADIDDDGDQDLVLQASFQPIHLLINHEGSTRSWVKFDVCGSNQNTSAIGSRIDLRVGPQWQQRQVLGGEGLQGQPERTQQFGLDQALVIDEIVVTWPGGSPQRTLTNYPALETWKLVPPADLGDLDGDDDRDTDDFLGLLDCMTNTGTASIVSGCEAADIDGDGDVDLDDFDLFAALLGGTQEDCNANGVGDLEDIATGTSLDADGDAVPDECAQGDSFCQGDGGDQAGCSDCPCGNEAAPGTEGGCSNGNGTSARLVWRGQPRYLANDLRIELRDANPNTFAVLTSGAARAPANAQNPCFGSGSGIQSVNLDGLRCVVQGVLRHGSRPTDSSGDAGVTTNGWGPPNGPAGGLIAQGGFAIGQTRHFQAVYRELVTLSCMRGQNTTQGLSFTVIP